MMIHLRYVISLHGLHTENLIFTAQNTSPKQRGLEDISSKISPTRDIDQVEVSCLILTA
jgi:hypothetical protein